jgi:hypothetical protein
VLASVIERIGADTPASLSLESKMLGAPFAPSTAGQIAKLISSIRPARKKGPVRAAATFEQQTFEPQLAVQDLQRQRQIELLLAGEDVGDAILAKTRPWSSPMFQSCRNSQSFKDVPSNRSGRGRQ